VPVPRDEEKEDSPLNLYIVEHVRRCVRPELRWIEDERLGWLAEDTHIGSMRQRSTADKLTFALVNEFFSAIEAEH